MKIKEVCEQTQLTPRTIRLYIEENLITPKYNENYLGRKSYNFSDKDIQKLLNIATLRKFGFSIAEIRQIFNSRDSSAYIINNICNKKTKTIQDESQMLSVLSKLNNGECYSVDEIAKVLNSCPENLDLPKDDTISKLLLLLKSPKQLIKKILIAADKLLFFASLGLSLFFIAFFFAEWKYPHFSDVRGGLLYLFLTSIPAILILSIWFISKIIAKKRFNGKTINGKGLVSAILVLVSLIPILLIGIAKPVESFTTNMNNYCRIDKCDLYKNAFYKQLFPAEPNGAVRKNNKLTYPNSNYYYRCRAVFEYTVDIYAEWSLNDKNFKKEIDRVRKLYFSYEYLYGEEDVYDYTEIKTENYTCLIRYFGDSPFSQAKVNYYYCIFAYDEVNMRVRYIACYSDEHGAEQPYYLQLDW